MTSGALVFSCFRPFFFTHIPSSSEYLMQTDRGTCQSQWHKMGLKLRSKEEQTLGPFLPCPFVPKKTSGFPNCCLQTVLKILPQSCGETSSEMTSPAFFRKSTKANLVKQLPEKKKKTGQPLLKSSSSPSRASSRPRPAA